MAAFAAVGGTSAVYWVVPVLGAAAVWLTFLLGRRYADATSGAAAALLLATSPIFLYQVVQPMSDVPVTAWWLLSLWGASTGSPVVAGVGAAAAVLTRPNLAPASMVTLAAVLAHAYARERTPGAALRAVVLFVGPLAAAIAFVLWLNARFYGSPLRFGYGTASELFAVANVPTNISRYARWLLDTQTPLLLIGLLAPILARRSRRAATPLPPAQSWLGLAFAALVVACYLPYSPFEEWWYLRFLLPAIPVMLVLTTAVCVRLVSAAPGAVRAPLIAAGLALLATHYVALANARSAFDLRRLESRYVAAGAFASGQLPGNAVLLSVQQSGTLRLYGGRTTVRFDRLDPNGLDAALEDLHRSGYSPYFALEAWEEAQFRERFARSSPLGLLDWPPMAEVGRPVKVRFYDPRDRRRFLAGEPVATRRDPLDGRGPR
jgi:4-amino-4-deoxy-L-arabinose transferase-like glycosyltransferase